jgi:hypothetical protein
MTDDLFESLGPAVQELGRGLRATEAYMAFIEEREIVVHCDNRVLHSPGVCVYCDKYPEAQAFRKGLHMKFTDELEPDEAILPGQERTRASADRWGGNQGKKER